MGKSDDSGGMRGSDAEDRPPPEDRKIRKDVRISTNTTVDEASVLRAEGTRAELIEASARLGLDASTRAFNSSLDRLTATQEQLGKANAEIGRLQTELGKAQWKSGKKKVAKIKAETKRHEIDQRTAVIKHAITTLAPGAMHLAPKLALLADKYLPTVLSAARSGDSTPAAAAIRLFAEINDPDPESAGAQCLETLQLLAGPADWAFIQQGLAELAASSPAAVAAASAPSYVGVHAEKH